MGEWGSGIRACRKDSEAITPFMSTRRQPVFRDQGGGGSSLTKSEFQNLNDRPNDRMPKTLPSAIGFDLGDHTLKAVLIHRKGASRYALAGFSVQELNGAGKSADALVGVLRTAMRELGGNSKYCSVATTPRHSILRIIDQPETPPDLLRQAIALNSMTLLNQDCKEFVIDCDTLDPRPVEPAKTAKTAKTAKSAKSAKIAGDKTSGKEAEEEREEKEEKEEKKAAAPRKAVRYLVGGMPRERVKVLMEAFGKLRCQLMNLQLAPISNLNAFGMANPEAFSAPAFMLVDVGHEESSVLLGIEGNLKLVRTIDYGGRIFLDAVTTGGAIESHAAITLLQQGDTGMAEASRNTVSQLAREIQSSIAFFEGQYEQSIRGIFLSGAICRAELPLQMLSDELDLPCQLWDPFSQVEINLPTKRKAELSNAYVQLGGAFGAALEILDTRP